MSATSPGMQDFDVSQVAVLGMFDNAGKAQDIIL